MKSTVSALRSALAKVNKSVRSTQSMVSMSSDEQSIFIEKTDGLSYVRVRVDNLDRTQTNLVDLDGGRVAALLATAQSDEAVEFKPRDDSHLSMKLPGARITLQVQPQTLPLMQERVQRLTKRPLLGEGVKAGALQEALRAVMFAAGKKDIRNFLNGVLLTRNAESGTLVSVATNGHVLATQESDLVVPEFPDTIVPNMIAEAIVAAFDVDAMISLQILERSGSPTSISITGPDIEMLFPVVGERFPDWSRVVPKMAGRGALHVNVASFENAVQRVEILTQDDPTHAILLNADLAESTFTVSTRDNSPSQVNQKVLVEGGARNGDAALKSIGLNVGYLASALDHVQGSNVVELYFGADGHALLLTHTDKKWRCVIMPMRV